MNLTLKTLIACIALCLQHHTVIAAALAPYNDPATQQAISTRRQEIQCEWQDFDYALHKAMTSLELKPLRDKLRDNKAPGLKDLYFAHLKIKGPGSVLEAAQDTVAYYTILFAHQPEIAAVWTRVLAGHDPITGEAMPPRARL